MKKLLLAAILAITNMFVGESGISSQPLPLEIVQCQEFFANVENGKINLVADCLGRNPMLKAKLNEDGYTALIVATRAQQTDMVEFLLHNGVDVGISSTKKMQAIHYAALNGDLPTLKALVDHGASVYVKTGKGRSVFQLASDCGNKHLKKYVNVNFKNKKKFF